MGGDPVTYRVGQMKTLIRKRLVFHLGGYNPMPPDAVHGRFAREARRFEQTWSVSARVLEPSTSETAVRWRIETEGPNWQIATEYRGLRWDDLVAARTREPLWRSIPLGLVALIDFATSGALSGYLRTNWRYAAFFLYPFLLLTALAGVALVTGSLAVKGSGSVPVGLVAGLVAFAALVHWVGRRAYLDLLLGDWIFSRTYVRGGDTVLIARLDALAAELVEAAEGGQMDEIIVLGHSLGAVLAVDLLDRALDLDPHFASGRVPIGFVSVGSSILKIALHRRATRLRMALKRVASTPGLFWAEYQTLTDVMNFYRTEPLVVLGLGSAGRPMVRRVSIRRMLASSDYRRIRKNLFRVHRQFVSANTRRAPYDYFMLLCGPISAQSQACSADGAVSAIGVDGALLTTAPRDADCGRSRCSAR